MDAIAAKLIEKAAAGDIAAIKEFGDRVDGKAPQAVQLSGDPDNPLVQRIERVVVKPKPDA